MKKEFIIGAFGLITLIGFIWSYKFLEGKNVFSADNYYHVSYGNVANLGISSEVQIKGFKVGNVTKVQLDPNDVTKLRVDFSVSGDINLPKSTIAAIKTGGVMGEKSIELIFDKICVSDCVVDGDELISGKVGLIQSMIPDEDLEQFFDVLSSNAKSLTDSLKSDSTGMLNATMRNIEYSTIGLALMTKKLNRMLDRSAIGIEKSINNTESITANLAANNDRITSILSGLETTLTKINGNLDRTFDNTNGSIVAVKSSLEKVDHSFVELSKLLTEINQGEGTINRLLHDKKTADELEFAIQNLGLLLQDFRLNPKRYVNVSVFGKKQKEYNNPEMDPAFKKEDEN